MATNAKYKVYSGSDWVEYHFTTNAAQVSTTDARKFLTTSVTVNGYTAGTTGAKVTVGSGNAANIEVNGAHITGQAAIDTTNNNSALHYIAATDSVAVALGKLDRAANEAYNHADLSGVVPYTGATSDVNLGNHSLSLSTLNLYYYSGGNTISCGGFGVSSTGDLYVESSANGGVYFDSADGVYIGTSKGTNNSNQVATKGDFANYVPTTRTVNSKALSSNITLYGTDIVMSSNDNSTLQSAISAVQAKANGLTTAYAVDTTTTGTNIYNSSFDSTVSDLEIAAAQTTGSTSNGKITVLNASGSGTTEVKLDDLKVGDSIFVKKTNVPDRWYAGKTAGAQGTSKIVYHFYILETYNMTWEAISNKPTLSISGQTVTIGSNSVVVPALAPATSGSSNPNNGTATTAARSDHTHSTYIPLVGTTALNGSIVPTTNNQRSLGSTSYNFAAVHTQTVNSYDYLGLYGTTNIYLYANNSTGLVGIKGSSNFVAQLKTANLTANKTYQFPNKDGTFAMTSDLSGFRKVTVASTAPSNPATGDIWIEA